MVMFNPISETGVRRGCFLRKQLFFLQGCVRQKLFVNEMEKCVYGPGGAESFYFVVVMKFLVRRVNLLRGTSRPLKAFLPLGHFQISTQLPGGSGFHATNMHFWEGGAWTPKRAGSLPEGAGIY